MHNPQDSSKRQVSFKKGDMVVRIPEYFEFKEGNSSKFWEINHLTLTSFTTCWGKIGSKGRISTKEFVQTKKPMVTKPLKDLESDKNLMIRQNTIS